mgnify:FL=1
MKKRILAFLLAVSIAVSMLAMPAAAVQNNTAVQMALTLGAMDNAQTTQLNAPVTRGAFARMLTAFSNYRDSVSAQGTVGTLFADVPSDSANAPYVRIAVQNGWMNGYTDGSFRPDNAVTLEETCTAVLKLLGYKMTELSGAFPQAQLNKASQLGLRTNLNCGQGQPMNYQDCSVLLYNALTANTSGGGSYGASLGFTVTDGQVDPSSVMMASLKGPFIAAEGAVLPFEPLTIYRNDKASSSAQLDPYDVYYYSESLQSVWIYTRRAAGRITAVSPSASAPTSVTVAGVPYQIGSADVAAQISSLNGGGVGEVVTLLLGMNNVAAGIVTGAAADDVYYGVVSSASRSLVEENGADVLQTVSVVCTDGITRSVRVDKSMNFPKSWLVEVRVTPEGETVTGIANKSLSGKFDLENSMLGSTPLADDVEILDTTTGGAAGTVRPSRLSGVNLNGLDVRYYTLNEKGQIDRLILNDVTGDLWKYGVLNDIQTVAGNWSQISALVDALVNNKAPEKDETPLGDQVAGVLVPTTSEILWGVVNGTLADTLWEKLTTNTGPLLSIGIRQLAQLTGTPFSTLLDFMGQGAYYICYVNGQPAAYSTSIKYPVIAGGVAVSQESNGSVANMAQLMPLKIDKIGAATVQSGSKRVELADMPQVYLWYKGQYYPTKLSAVNSEDYTLTGWYDNFGAAAGKKVRVIIAVKKD